MGATRCISEGAGWIRSFSVAVARSGVLVVLLLAGAASSATGQTIWSRPYATNQIALETIVPAPVEGGTSDLSGAAFLSAAYSLTDHIEVAAELPVVGATAPVPGASTALGNPYVGVGLSGTSTPVLVEVGARLPVAASDPVLGSVAEADVGRTRAFHPNEIALSLLLNGRLPIGRTSSLRLRAGAAYASFSPSDTTGRRTEQDGRLQYSLQYWHEGETVVLGLSLTGSTLLTGPGDLVDDSRYHLVGSVMGDGPVIQPGVLVGLSLKDLEAPAPVVGLTFSLPYSR